MFRPLAITKISILTVFLIILILALIPLAKLAYQTLFNREFISINYTVKDVANRTFLIIDIDYRGSLTLDNVVLQIGNYTITVGTLKPHSHHTIEVPIKYINMTFLKRVPISMSYSVQGLYTFNITIVPR